MATSSVHVSHIRNFCIISHIDHGKSTLADRLLEITGTVEKRKMRAQFLDSMDIERERGITIKMQPVRMIWKPKISEIQKLSGEGRSVTGGKIENSKIGNSDSEYILNLIDTPGHIDFSYEVSRSLAAVEGAILLVDASQGVQAQTLSNVELARSLGKVIIPAVNKIDLPYAKISETKDEIVSLLGCKAEDILEISGKTGAGVPHLLEVLLDRIPSPIAADTGSPQALIFDFEYSTHQGVIAYVRIVKGEIIRGKELFLATVGERFECVEVGIFKPERFLAEKLGPGEIGYVVTNIKKPEIVKVGDTITSFLSPETSLPGYREPSAMVWANVYPVSQDDFDSLKKALQRLHLIDSSFSFEEEASSLGRGFRCGFLGLLHIEIIMERVKREFGLEVVLTSPTVRYELTLRGGNKETVYSSSEFREDHEIQSVEEPWIRVDILTPPSYMGDIFSLFDDYEAIIGETENFGSRIKLHVEMPLRELMREFYDKLKSVTSGYASLDYAFLGYRNALVTRIDVLVHDEQVPALSRVVSRKRVEREARVLAEKLKKILPRQLFAYKVQVKAYGRIIASEAISALKKDVTGYLYGGDRTRKMKLWQKQKKGKKRLQASGSVSLPHEVFIKILQS